MLRPLKQARSALQKQYDEIALQAQELTTAREALDTTPLGSGPAMGEAEMALHNELVRRVRVQFINAEGAVADAANAFVWATVDADTAVSRLNLALSRFDEATEAITGAPPVKGRPLSDVQYRREVRDQLRERTSVVQEVLRTMPDDPRVKAIANIEAQTAAWDMEALQWRVSQKEIEKQIAVLDATLRARAYLARAGVGRLPDSAAIWLHARLVPHQISPCHGLVTPGFGPLKEQEVP